MSYNGCDVLHVTVVPDMVHKSDGNGNLVVFDEQSEGLNLIITPVRLASPSKAIMNTHMQQEGTNKRTLYYQVLYRCALWRTNRCITTNVFIVI